MLHTGSDHTSKSKIQPYIHMPIYFQPANDRRQTTINLISTTINEQRRKTFLSISALALLHTVKLTDRYVGCAPTESPQAGVYLHFYPPHFHPSIGKEFNITGRAADICRTINKGRGSVHWPNCPCWKFIYSQYQAVVLHKYSNCAWLAMFSHCGVST